MTESLGDRRGHGWAIGLSLKQAVRRLMGAPSFALTAIVMLALCLGGNATLLSFLVTLGWRPQPGVREAGPLVHIMLRDTKRLLDYANPSELQSLRAAHARTLTLASYAPSFAMVGRTRAAGARTVVEFTSPTFFDLLGTRTITGRLLTPRDSAADVETPVVISERLWQSTFAARSDMVGQRIYVDEQPAVVVGVAEPGFHGPEGLVQADVWLPITDSEKEYGASRILGRLHSGFDIVAARTELGVVWQNVVRQEAVRLAALGRPPRITSLAVAPLRAGLHPEQAPVMQRLLGGAVAVSLLVLLIACLNLSGLTLSRVLARGPEIAVRRALGSSRLQLWVDIGAEVVVLFVVGTGVGLLIASFIGRGLMLAMAQPFPFTLDVRFNGPTFALSLGLMSLSVIAATLIPGLHTMSVAPANALRADARTAGVSKVVRRVQGAFVVAQLASAMLLSAGVITAVVTVGRILNFSIGVVSPETLVKIESAAPAAGDGGSDVALERVRQLPAVIAAVRAYQVPAGGSLQESRVRRFDSLNGTGVLSDSGWDVKMNVVSAGFFATIGAPVLRGREFTASDDRRSLPVAVISRSAASQFFPGGEAVGRELAEGGSGRRLMIVGVVANVLYDPSHPDDKRAVYLATPQAGTTGERAILARLRVPATDAALSSGLGASAESVRSVDELLRESTESLRAVFALLFAAGVLGVSLALTGVYGMVAYAARRREREIGVRLALGASSANVTLVFARGIFASVALAGATALLAWPVARRILPDTMQVDITAQWVALVVAAIVLGAAALGAAVTATWRPAHADPMHALRAE